MSFKHADKITLLQHIAHVYKKVSDKQGWHDSQVFLSRMLVVRAIDRAIIDLDRMCVYHLESGKQPDRHKIAGFLSRWIAKERPIQLKGELPLNLVTEQLQWANALFAVFVMSSFLKGEGVTGHLGRYLKHWFAFRDERGEVLSLVAYCCEELSKCNDELSKCKGLSGAGAGVNTLLR